MPFTATHIAAVLPIAWLLRWNVPLSALAIGAMVCDLGVFFPDLFNYWTMHSVAGLVTHCLPFGFALFFLFHWLIKRPLCALLPVAISSRLTPWIRQMPSFGVIHLLVIAGCILCGSATHVLWDSFTHYNRWGTEQFPVLNGVVMEFEGKVVYWYTVLQHGSSVVFLPILFVVASVWMRRQKTMVDNGLSKLPLAVKAIAAASLVCIPVLSYLYCRLHYPWASHYTVIHEAVKLACTLLILEVLFYGLAYSLMEYNLNDKESVERNP